MTILVVDEERDFADALAQLLTLRGHVAESCHDAGQALSHVRARPFDVVLVGVSLRAMSSLAFAQTVSQERPRTQVYLLTMQPLPPGCEIREHWTVLQKPMDTRDFDKLIAQMQSD